MTDTPPISFLAYRVEPSYKDEPNGPHFDVVGNDGHTEERLVARAEAEMRCADLNAAYVKGFNAGRTSPDVLALVDAAKGMQDWANELGVDRRLIGRIDAALRPFMEHINRVRELIAKAENEPDLHNKGTDRLLSAIEKAEPEQPERFDEMTGPMPDESGASGGYGFSEKSPRYTAALGCGQWVVRDNRPGPQDPWEVAVGLGEDEARKMAELLNSGVVRTSHVTVTALVSALQGLRDIIHDDLTHARQRDHHEAIRAADVLLAAAKGGA